MTQRSNLAGLLIGAALAVMLPGAAAAQTDATTPLAGYADFSGAESQLVFDDLGLVNGDDVASVGDVEFSLTAGGPAKYYEDSFPRELGPAGPGSVNNFWGFTAPYPDLDLLFANPVHRLGFELRANENDDVSVTLLSNGEVVDELVVPSRGSDAFYFYGYENLSGFDEVRVDVVANFSGAFLLDNLTFEALGGGEEPPEEPGASLPTFACEGFESFPPAEAASHRRRVPFRVLVARLTDADGNLVAPEALSEPPAIRVLFTPDGSDEAQDVTGAMVWGRAEHFVPTRRGKWLAWLSSWRMREPGVYMTLLESGDPATYVVDPACADWTVSEPPSPEQRWKHRRDRHRRR